MAKKNDKNEKENDGWSNDLIYIPGATVKGSGDEGVFKEGTTTTINDFYMSKYEVTQEEFKEVIDGLAICDDRLSSPGEEKYKFENHKIKRLIDASPSRCKPRSTDYKLKVPGEKTERHPVDSVTIYEAMIYCNQKSKKEGLTLAYAFNFHDHHIEKGHVFSIFIKDLVKGANGYRLPTEAEWEFAARGADPNAADWNYAYSGKDRTKDKDSEFDPALDEIAWYANNNLTGITTEERQVKDKDGNRIAEACGTHEVGKKKPNRLGLYDMTGNVFEWTNTKTGGGRGLIASESFAIKGGNWFEVANNISVLDTFTQDTLYPLSITGFRVARSAIIQVPKDVELTKEVDGDGKLKIIAKCENTKDPSFDHLEIYYTTNDGKTDSEKSEILNVTNGEAVFSDIDKNKAYYTFYFANVDKYGKKSPEVFYRVNINEDLIKMPENFVFVKGCKDKTGALEINRADGKRQKSRLFTNKSSVTLSSFYMDKYEISWKEYERVMKNQIVTVNGENCILSSRGDYIFKNGFREPEPEKAYNDGLLDNTPITSITWYDAIYYCNARSKMEGLECVYTIKINFVVCGHIKEADVTWDRTKNGYRLPTELEWEYAAMNGDPGEKPDTTTECLSPSVLMWGWYQLGKKKPNYLGLYDMIGGDSEFFYDMYCDYKFYDDFYGKLDEALKKPVNFCYDEDFAEEAFDVSYGCSHTEDVKAKVRAKSADEFRERATPIGCDDTSAAWITFRVVRNAKPSEK